ncbi:MAG TPA: lysophospholipid acyltransferase family protein, partial [Chthoniobacterales bacterium]|nr:lysophospholipid acyltransferase family protein [Chthoniobacterales bacterium]
GVLIDQSAGYAGLWMPLFGRLTSSSTLAATLSIRTGVPVLPLAMYTSGRARWKLSIGTPVYPDGDDPELLTAEINRLLEEQIRASPADWLWGHNRWKALRPHLLFARDQRRVFLPPGFDRANLDPFRILIVSPPGTAEAAAALPAVCAIAEGRPDTWIAVLSSSNAAAVWRNAREVQQVIEWSDSDSLAMLSSKIRASAAFDAAIFFDANWKTAFAVWRAGVPIRVGRAGGLIGVFYNQHPPESGAAGDAVSGNLQIAHSIGANIPGAAAPAG